MDIKEIWRTEPDRLEFEHCGVQCLVLRNVSMGFLCGYIKVDQTHPLYGVECERISNYFEAHRGLTYSGPLEGDGEEWFIGFDCGRAGDLIPEMAKFIMTNVRDTYRDIEYVSNEVRRMAETLQKNRLNFLFI